MNFTDSPEGQTHSYGDGCGIKEHNMTSLKSLEQEALADFQSKIEYGVSNNPWAIDYIDEIAPQIKEWIIAYGRKVAEGMLIKENDKEHICAFNDGEQNCPCWRDARAEQLRRKDEA